jgi:peroxiredoxin Q/BCP
MMLEKGQQLPPFELPDQDGRKRTFAGLVGPKGLVLYFYPKDNTPGCTLEAQGFRDRLEEFRELGYNVAGVSRDSVQSHTAFIERHRLPFTLLSDAEGALSEATGAWGEKVLYGKRSVGMIRSTFVAGLDGTLLKVYPRVSAKGHVEKLLSDLKGMGGTPSV